MGFGGSKETRTTSTPGLKLHLYTETEVTGLPGYSRGGNHRQRERLGSELGFRSSPVDPQDSGQGAQHEEMSGSLLHCSSQCNESQAPSKSTAKVPFLLQGFLLQAVKTRVKDKF